MARAALEHRLRQRDMWKAEGLRSMKNLDKITKGLKFLDNVLEIIFSHERKIYERSLGGQKRK
jgi:hypothetical protein